MDARKTLAFKIAREDGYAYPNSVHVALADAIESGREAEQAHAAIMAELRKLIGER